MVHLYEVTRVMNFTKKESKITVLGPGEWGYIECPCLPSGVVIKH